MPGAECERRDPQHLQNYIPTKRENRRCNRGENTSLGGSRQAVSRFLLNARGIDVTLGFQSDRIYVQTFFSERMGIPRCFVAQLSVQTDLCVHKGCNQSWAQILVPQQLFWKAL